MNKPGCLSIDELADHNRELLLLMMARRGMERHDVREFSAADVISQAVEKHGDRLCLGWSGGKCSTIVLHLALK